jgi:hypothetical protein
MLYYNVNNKKEVQNAPDDPTVRRPDATGTPGSDVLGPRVAQHPWVQAGNSEAPQRARHRYRSRNRLVHRMDRRSHPRCHLRRWSRTLAWPTAPRRTRSSSASTLTTPPPPPPPPPREPLLVPGGFLLK